MPWLLTRIVPSALEAVFTMAALDGLLVVWAAGCVLAAELVVLLLVELLPQAASRRDAARAGGDSFSRWRMYSLLRQVGRHAAACGPCCTGKDSEPSRSFRGGSDPIGSGRRQRGGWQRPER